MRPITINLGGPYGLFSTTMTSAQDYPASLLDFGSIDHKGDISLQPLLILLPNLRVHSYCRPEYCADLICNDRIIITNKVVLDEALLTKLPRLELICIAATGTNNIDLQAAKACDIAVCNTTNYATAAVVQHVFALITSLQTRLCQYARAVRLGDWARAEHFCLLDYPIRELAGLKLGIIGYGVLGQAVARVAQAFGMEVIIAQRPGASPVPNRTPLNELLREADLVSLHCPLAENTRNLIDAAALALMKPNALLINTARGGIVDENALAEALVAGRIGGAGIDVLEQEPPIDSPLLGLELPNLLITPHIAWASLQARQRLINEIAENISAYFRGEQRNRVV